MCVCVEKKKKKRSKRLKRRKKRGGAEREREKEKEEENHSTKLPYDFKGEKIKKSYTCSKHFNVIRDGEFLFPPLMKNLCHKSKI